MHSFWSDGHGFPEMIAAWFRQRGYHFIAFTEHDRHQTGEKWVSDHPETAEGKSLRQFDLIARYKARFGTDWVQQRVRDDRTEVRLRPLNEYRSLLEEPGQFAIFTGEEVTAPFGTGELHHTHWINVYNLPHSLGRQPAAPTSVTAIQRICQAARSGMASFNHPNWKYNATPRAVADAADLRFMEIHTALDTCNNDGDVDHPSVEQLWDYALTLRLQNNGSLIYGLATDDSHAYDTDHPLLGSWALPGRAWIMVHSRDLTQSGIFASIDRGDFYASTGVTLRDLDITREQIRIDIDTQPGVTYTTRFIGSTNETIGQVFHETKSPNPAYRFTRRERYVRAIIVSDRPHPNPHRPGETEKAWVQPVVVNNPKDHS